MAVGSRIPTRTWSDGPRADKPRVGRSPGRASAPALFAGQGGVWRAPPGPAVWAHIRGGGRQSKPDQGPTSQGPAAGSGGQAPWLELDPCPEDKEILTRTGRGRAEVEFGSRPAKGEGRGHRPGLPHVHTRAAVKGHTVGRE